MLREYEIRLEKDNTQMRCEVCEKLATETCASEDQPMLAFCVHHFIEHVTAAHPPEYWLQARVALLNRLEYR